MPMKTIGFFQRLLLRATFILYIPRVIKSIMAIKQDKNPLHDGVRKLSGKKHVAMSSDILFKDVKAAAKL
jgi:hypothetical protein